MNSELDNIADWLNANQRALNSMCIIFHSKRTNHQ